MGPSACRREASAVFFSCIHLERGVLGVGMRGAWGILLLLKDACILISFGFVVLAVQRRPISLVGTGINGHNKSIDIHMFQGNSYADVCDGFFGHYLIYIHSTTHQYRPFPFSIPSNAWPPFISLSWTHF